MFDLFLNVFVYIPQNNVKAQLAGWRLRLIHEGNRCSKSIPTFITISSYLA
jgi:hypothetical protein